MCFVFIFVQIGWVWISFIVGTDLIKFQEQRKNNKLPVTQILGKKMGKDLGDKDDILIKKIIKDNDKDKDNLNILKGVPGVSSLHGSQEDNEDDEDDEDDENPINPQESQYDTEKVSTIYINNEKFEGEFIIYDTEIKIVQFNNKVFTEGIENQNNSRLMIYFEGDTNYAENVITIFHHKSRSFGKHKIIGYYFLDDEMILITKISNNQIVADVSSLYGSKRGVQKFEDLDDETLDFLADDADNENKNDEQDEDMDLSN